MGASSGATALPDAPPVRRELDEQPVVLPFRQRLHQLLLGPPPGEEVTPYVPVAEPIRPAGLFAKWGVFVLCALGGLVGAVLIVASAPVWYLAEPSWRLTVPGIPHPGTSFQATSTFIFGLVLMALAWIGLIGRAERAPISRRCRLVAVGIASPLVLLHLIGGSHNDALMMGLLAVGVAAFLRKRRWLGMALVILATGAKVPAAAGIIFLAWNWYDDPDTSIWQRVKATAIAGVGSMAAISVLSVLVGIQIGWMAALKSTGSVYSTFSVSTKLGFLTASGLQTIGLNVSSDGTVALFRLVGIALAGIICTVLLLRSPRIGMTRALGISMIVVVLLSPVVWPWYLAAGFALVAASGMGKWRPSYVVLIVAASAVVFPTSIAPVKSLNPYQHLLTMAVVLLIVFLCYLAQKLAGYLSDRRVRVASTPVVELPLEPAALAAAR